MKYKVMENTSELFAGQITIEYTDSTGQKWWIPNDPANSDYQQYLRWLEDPNADEFQPPLEG